ncbi:MAG: hypothetical protein KGJ49_04995 [Alphaproteobacteria bacterium]|nr:hypothetical protein [Alphaproteobacteria bacterium]
MGYEGFTTWSEKKKKSEKRTIIIRTTDKVVHDLTHPKPLDDLSQDTKRVMERILRENNRGRKTVVSGQTKAVAAWIHQIILACTEVR